MSHNRNKSGSSSKLWFVAGAAVLAVAALVGISLRSAPGGGGAKAGSDAAIGAVRNAHGKADAKVVLVEYGDYL